MHLVFLSFFLKKAILGNLLLWQRSEKFQLVLGVIYYQIYLLFALYTTISLLHICILGVCSNKTRAE